SSLEGRNLLLLAQCHGDGIAAAEQAVAPEGVDDKVGDRTAVVAHLLVAEVDRPRRRPTTSVGNWTGRRPFCRELAVKMSPKDGAMTTLKPIPESAQTACSREDPQPKLRPVMRMLAPPQAGSLSSKSGRGWPPSA